MNISGAGVIGIFQNSEFDNLHGFILGIDAFQSQTCAIVATAKNESIVATPGDSTPPLEVLGNSSGGVDIDLDFLLGQPGRLPKERGRCSPQAVAIVGAAYLTAYHQSIPVWKGRPRKRGRSSPQVVAIVGAAQ